MQLLVQAREQLPPEACSIGSSSAGYSSSSSSSRGQQGHQQQHAAWQLVCAQVQYNLLLVLQLTKHWEHHNAHRCFLKVLQNNSRSVP